MATEEISAEAENLNNPAEALSFGIEEEYFLVHRGTRDLVHEEQPKLMAALKSALGDQVCGEFLCSQIEIGTRVCHSPQDARSELARLRRTVVELADAYGLSVMAASTHPFARWSEQTIADQPRYHDIAHDLAGVGQRLSTCGMHVHAGIDDREMRISVMNRARQFLPLLLALSSSSPFWQGRNTGLRCFRLAVTDSQPRSGLPEHFDDWDHYQQAIALLRGSGAIDDPTKIWWDIRPSSRFPTLEMRITDICPRIEDAVTVALLFVCICRMLCRTHSITDDARSLLVLNENRWRAQRYGIGGELIDFQRRRLIPCALLVQELLTAIAQDAEVQGCIFEIDRVAEILTCGTSADRQVTVYNDMRRTGCSDAEALKGVVDLLVSETRDI
jgi:glutamate---cysteine ligase / carboxylate-amine ligase